MRQRLRAPLAAAIAWLFVGGRFFFAQLWLFLAFEALSARRRLLDWQTFLLGAAAGLLHDGILTKVLQDGACFLGVDFLAALSAGFDWGMTAVVVLHVVDALLPRPVEEERPEKFPRPWALSVLSLAALIRYISDALAGHLRLERMLGPRWPLADLLFAAAAAALVAPALIRLESGQPQRMSRPILALAAWRVVGAAALYFFPELPLSAAFLNFTTRLAFIKIFFSHRLAV